YNDAVDERSRTTTHFGGMRNRKCSDGTSKRSPSPKTYEMSLDELEHLSKFNDGNTASAFICCSRALCCNIGMLFSKFLDAFSKCACTFSVDNGYFLITGEQGIIHIFF